MLLCDAELQEINNHFQDELSKNIFVNRMMYSITKDADYLVNICNVKTSFQRFRNFFDDNKYREKILFGIGRWAGWIVDTFQYIKWDYCTDNRAGCNFRGIQNISVNEVIEHHKDACILITVKYFYNEIFTQLVGSGFNKEQILCFGELELEAEKGIYFDLPQMKNKKSGKEIFVDAGGYDGKTSMDFNIWSKGEGQIYFFEPNEDALNEAKSRLCKMNNICFVNKGLYSSSRLLSFQNDGTESRIIENGDSSICVTSLDEYLGMEQVSFIKMDIEGAELDALAGAEGIIKRWKPKLAVSIYHKPEDIFEIPKLLLQFNDDYKFWMRHYSLTCFDTVLYAI